VASLIPSLLVGLSLSAAAEPTEAAPAESADDVAARPRGRGSRIALGIGSGVGFAAGAAWYFVLGDTYGAGDPASLMVGGGMIGAGGVLAGAAVAGLAGDDALVDAVSSPAIAAGLGYNGGAWAGEAIPYSPKLSLSPAVPLGDWGQLGLSSSASTDLGASLDLDPRPQAGTEPVLEASGRSVDLSAELQVYATRHVWFALRPMTQVRVEQFQYADGQSQTLHRRATMPATAGAWFNVSDRQRFGMYVGPRWDRIRTGDGEGSTWLGPLYGEAHYDLQLDHGRLLWGESHSRVRLSYLHTNFDGAGFNAGAMVGFAGPFRVEWDLSIRKPDARWAWQAGLDADIGEGGGAAMSIGLTPPNAWRKR